MHIEQPQDEILEKIKRKLRKWETWLSIDGANTKGMVRQMNKEEKLKSIEETLDNLYSTLPKTTIEGVQKCVIAIYLLEKIKRKLEVFGE